MKTISRLLFTFLFGISLATLALLAARGQSVAASDAPVVAIRYVATTGSDATDCTDSANPCATIQYAVDEAGEGDDVRVAEGAYTGVNNTGGNPQLVYISKTLTLRGGYTLTNWTSADPFAHPTILDAEGLGRGIYAIGPLTLTVEGLQIIGGVASGDGGGLYGEEIVLHAEANQFLGNSASNDGAGIYLLNSLATLTHNIFSENIADADGGGLNADYSTLFLNGNTFSGNTALNGGGVYLLESPTRADSNTLSGNTASYWGGGIRLDVGSAFTATNTLIVDNQTGIFGSGLFADTNQPIHLIHTTLANNQGGSGSGIFTVNDMWLTNTVLVSQTVGIFIYDGATAHFEATLWNNDFDWSGGGTIVTGTINLDGDPGFVDPANDDYHLTPDSLAVDAGIDAGVPTDLDDEARPFGEGFDLGADEWIGVAALEVDKTAHADEILAGDMLTYTLRLTNTGTLPLHARITDTLPASVTPTGVLTWTAIILPGQGWTQTVVVTSSEIYSGTLTNTLTVTTEEGVSGTATALVTAILPTPPEYRQYLPLVIR